MAHDKELRRTAKVSGMRSEGLPSLEQVERRRFELWLISTVLLVGLTSALGLLTLWSPESIYALLVQPGVRYGVVALGIGMSLYTVEKEFSLRRVSRLLFDERLLTVALSSRLHEISALLDAGRAVNSTLDLDRVLSSILTGATELMPATTGSVMLLEGHELVVAATVGNDGALGRRAGVGEGIAGRVALSREPLLINGPADAGSFPGWVVRNATVGCALSVPLLERGELLGVLNLGSISQDGFSEYDLRAVSLFAEQAATAIGKARLYARSQEQAAALEHAATHDGLTGLGNRTALQQRANGRQSLLFLDLDGFKDVNDRLGHAAGDEVLVAVAKRLLGRVSAGDLVVRFGGDEFAVLLEGVLEADAAIRVAERVQAAVCSPLQVGEHELCVTCSVGVAVPTTERFALDQLLHDADRALYAAKAAGKACVRAGLAALPSQRQLAPFAAI